MQKTQKARLKLTNGHELYIMDVQILKENPFSKRGLEYGKK